MGFSFRGKKDAATDVHAVSSGSDIRDPDQQLKMVKEEHMWDPFMDVQKLDAVDAAIASGDIEKEAAVEESLLEEDSPYMEVRSSVSSLALSANLICKYQKMLI